MHNDALSLSLWSTDTDCRAQFSNALQPELECQVEFICNTDSIQKDNQFNPKPSILQGIHEVNW